MRSAYLLLASVWFSLGAVAAEPVAIPFVTEVEIDGDVSEWKQIPTIGVWGGEASIVYGSVNHDGPADLGGTGWMGWDAENFYIAARIEDDLHRQTQSGQDMWRGDNVGLMLDADRQKDRKQTPFNGDDFQIIFSPGSLRPDSDWLFQLAPEAYVHQPLYVPAAGITVAASPRPDGYELEVAIPWSFLGVSPSSGYLIGFDLNPSDCDSELAVQQSMASLIPGKWSVGSTERMLDGVLTGGDGIDMTAVSSGEKAMSQQGPRDEVLRVAPPKTIPAPGEFSVLPGGGITVESAGQPKVIVSEYSAPDGRWLRLDAESEPGWKALKGKGAKKLLAESERFRLQREIFLRDECIEVMDTITNLTEAPLPIMTRHFVQWPSEDVSTVILGGSEFPLKRGRAQNATHPTLLMNMQDGSGFGMAIVDDVSRVHGMTYYLDSKAGIADSELTLAPGATYEQLWQVYVLPEGGYWNFVNAIRRQWESNFSIFGPFCFVDPRKSQGFPDLSTPEVRGWLAKRNCDYPSIMSYHSVQGQALHGLSRKLEGQYLQDLQALVNRLRQALPEVQVAHYWHCFITGSDAAGEADPADAILNDFGQQVHYGGNKQWPLFFPTLENDYGRKMWAQLQEMISTLDLDGLYWDEQERSYVDYHYGEPWDGISGVIDPETHELVRKRSNVALLTAPFRHQVMQWLADEGLYLICNGAPRLHSTAQFRIPRFTETGSLMNVYSTHLFSPIGLGDHRTEKTHADVMKAQRDFLRHGALYYYYSGRIPMENPGLLRWMYPITPVAIGPGYALGEDKIMTARGGLFSWGKKRLGDIEVHVIGPLGWEVPADYDIVREGKTEWIRLNLPEDHAAAILKK